MPIQKVTSGIIADGAIVATDIADGTVTGPKLGANSVSSNNIIASVTLTTPIVSGNLNLDTAGTTGIRVPAANTIAFYGAGTEDMRIDATGNVGIGTTNPAAVTGFSTGRKVLQVTPSGGGSAQLRLGATSGTMIDHDDDGNTITTIRSLYGSTSSSAQMQLQSGFITFGTGTSFTEAMRIDASGNLLFNSGYGSVATAYGCRAWVNFNGTGTVAIRGSGNVSSITDNGTGDYTINLTTAMPDVNFCTQLTGMRDSDGNGSLNATIRGGTYSTYVTTSTIRVLAENDSGTRVDTPYYGAAIFR